MRKIYTTLITIIVSFLFSFTCVGYAAVSHSLEIRGISNMSPQEGVFITDASAKSGNVTINGFTSSIVNSKVILQNNLNSTAVMELKVFNNAGEKFMFSAVKYQIGENTYSNSDISFHLTFINSSGVEVDLIPGTTSPIENGGYMTIYVNFEYADSVTSVTNTELLSILQFEFIKWEDVEIKEDEIIAGDVLDIFEDIVNTGDNDNDQIDTLFEKLIDEMDQYTDRNRDDNSYIGNVSGAHEDDITALDDLFGSSFKVNINGEEKEVKVMIKKENIDNNKNTGDESGNEMVIYMTTDTLEQTGSWFNPSDAIVYAAVYTDDQKGEGWYRKGEMYEGTCTIKQYNGWPGSGSFDTDTWRSTNANGQTANRTITQMIANA